MKPKVICHIMASVDGHIQVERWTAPSGDMPKTDLMKTYSDIGKTLCTDAWTFGKNTVRDIFHDKTCIFPIEEKDAEKDTPIGKTSVYIGSRISERMFISFDPDADIIYTASQLRGCDMLAVLDQATATLFGTFAQDGHFVHRSGRHHEVGECTRNYQQRFWHTVNIFARRRCAQWYYAQQWTYRRT